MDTKMDLNLQLSGYTGTKKERVKLSKEDKFIQRPFSYFIGKGRLDRLAPGCGGGRQVGGPAPARSKGSARCPNSASALFRFLYTGKETPHLPAPLGEQGSALNQWLRRIVLQPHPQRAAEDPRLSWRQW
ncbi:Interferon Regulatory Factor 6 [Manis pentadactyla]|nr:Interferon Regulatory Factor 6 [Manis pentadactyla]